VKDRSDAFDYPPSRSDIELAIGTPQDSLQRR
jgi:hypothetical protein